MSVLDCFSGCSQELGASDIAYRLGLQKSTVYNILSTLAMCGYLERNPISNKYYPSTHTLGLSWSALEHLNVRSVFYPRLKLLSDETHKICSIAALESSCIQCLYCVSPSDLFSYAPAMGETAPLHCTCSGKLFLAYMEESDIREILKKPLKAYTSLTITDPNELLAQLETIRSQGYALDNMEHLYGKRSVSIPIFNQEGQMLYAASMSAPSTHISLQAVDEMIQRLRTTFDPLQNKL